MLDASLEKMEQNINDLLEKMFNTVFFTASEELLTYLKITHFALKYRRQISSKYLRDLGRMK